MEQVKSAVEVMREIVLGECDPGHVSPRVLPLVHDDVFDRVDQLIDVGMLRLIQSWQCPLVLSPIWKGVEMSYTYHAQLQSMSAYILKLLTARALCGQTHDRQDLYDAAAAVICDYRGRRYTVRELMDQLDAQLLSGSDEIPEDLEHGYAKTVVSLAQMLGPIRREALLYVARYAVSSLDEPDVLESRDSRHVLKAQWDALSSEERSGEWQRCAELCEQGIGDSHRFYPIIMPQMLVGYVGD